MIIAFTNDESVLDRILISLIFDARGKVERLIDQN